MIPRTLQPPLFDDGRTRVVNLRLEPGWQHDRRYRYIGRRKGVDPRDVPPGEEGWAGNPWNVREHPDAMERHAAYLAERCRTDAAFLAAVEKLRGCVLGCFCVAIGGEGECHGKNIIRWLEARR